VAGGWISQPFSISRGCQGQDAKSNSDGYSSGEIVTHNTKGGAERHTPGKTIPNVANLIVGLLWVLVSHESPQSFSAFLEALAWRLCLGRALANFIRLVSTGIAEVRVSGLWALGKSLGDAAASRLSFGRHCVVSKRVDDRDKYGVWPMVAHQLRAGCYSFTTIAH